MSPRVAGFATCGDGWNSSKFTVPSFPLLVEDGDRRCNLIWASPVTLHFFSTLCADTLFPPVYFEPKPNLSKTLEGLLMRLVIFVNTIFQLNSLNIAVSVCYLSGSKVNRKEPSVIICLFLCSTLLNISVSEHLVPSCQCHVWSLKRA